jgi:peptide/nickel transport system substrate-binding protein
VKTHSSRAVGALIAAALLVAACGSDDDGGGAAAPGTTSAPGSSVVAETSAAAPDGCTAERRGGELSMAVGSETRGLDPTVSTGSGSTGGTELTAIYDTLMRWDPDTGAYEPRVAESLTPNADFSVWTLHLRPGLHFGNGDPFTTTAVKASIARHQDPANKSSSLVFAVLIADMHVVDDLTMTFTLTAPWAGFPYVLADEPGMITNPAVIDQLGPQAFSRAPVGAGVGPYEVESFSPGEGITMKAKDDYWGGPVCIDELHFVTVGDEETKYDALQTGEVQAAYLSDAKLIDDADHAGLAVHRDLVNGQMVMLNHGVRGSTPPTTDIRLRRAIIDAIDPKVVDERATGGLGAPTAALVEASSLYARGATGPKPDPDAARALVAEVKASTGWDGRLRLVCGNADEEGAIAIEGMLTNVGITVERTSVSTADLIQQVLADANYDAACWSLQLFEAGAWAKLDRFLRSDSPANRMGYANPAMDAALVQMRNASTVDEQAAAIGTIQQLWEADAISPILGATRPAIVSAPDVGGLAFNQETMAYFDKAYLR